MHSYHAHGPSDSKFAKVTLRVCTYPPKLYEESDKVKVVIQTMDGSEPIAEDPLYTGYVSQNELDLFLAGSREDGWVLEKDPMEDFLREHNEQRKAEGRKRWHAR